MTIAVGDNIPEIDLAIMQDSSPTTINTRKIFSGKKVILFALPGAFTPTCSAAHVPGFVIHHDAIKNKGVDTIACLATNDAYVMTAWGIAQNVSDNILMLGDGNGDFTRAVGLEIDLSASNMGMRSRRYAMIVDQGVVTHLNLEVPGEFEISDAQTMLTLL
jgi:peroxiredoxin